MQDIGMVYSDVTVISDDKLLSAGSYLTHRVIVDLDGGYDEFALSLVRVHAGCLCEVLPFKTETPSTVQLDAPVIIRQCIDRDNKLNTKI